VGLSPDQSDRLREDAFRSPRGNSASHHPGYYDEQHLAYVPKDGGRGLKPSHLRAQVVPNDTLENIRLEKYFRQWQHVATIVVEDEKDATQEPGLEQYEDGWGLAHRFTFGWWTRDLKPGKSILVEVRMDSAQVAGRDTIVWSARYRQRYPIYKPRGFTTAWSDPVAVNYAGPPITLDEIRKRGERLDGPPGTARWGWKEDDESVWVRCAVGCCELSFSYR
jgi:hypothetical protein